MQIGTKRMFALAAAFVTIVTGLSVFHAINAAGPVANPAIVAAKPRPTELAEIEVSRIQPKNMTEEIRISGALKPVNRVVLKAKLGGTISEITVRDGQTVVAGDVLVRFKTDDLISNVAQNESNLAAARAQHLFAEQTIEKTEQLVAKGHSTLTSLEKARSDLATAKANVQALLSQGNVAKTALEDSIITAPFSGVVVNRVVDPGEALGNNGELLTLVDVSSLEAEVLVPTREIGQLSVGSKAALKVEGNDNLALEGTVERISPLAREGTRSVPVFIRIENSDNRLWGGTFATGTIVTRERQNVIAVPATSIRKDSLGEFVLKVVDNKLIRQPVVAGKSWSNGIVVQIDQGLAANDTVVSAPLQGIDAGTEVAISRI